MINQNKIRYSSEYISYVEHGDSAAVFIVRDIVRTIDTTGTWIDVIETLGNKNEYGKWDFSSIEIELFPRKIKPNYSECSSDEDKKYITWETANKDITQQRSNGYRGKKYIICLKLVNKNKGKTITRKRIWNKKFHQYVPKDWMSSDCEVREEKVPIKPDWEYRIKSIERL